MSSLSGAGESNRSTGLAISDQISWLERHDLDYRHGQPSRCEITNFFIKLNRRLIVLALKLTCCSSFQISWSTFCFRLIRSRNWRSACSNVITWRTNWRLSWSVRIATTRIAHSASARRNKSSLKFNEFWIELFRKFIEYRRSVAYRSTKIALQVQRNLFGQTAKNKSAHSSLTNHWLVIS